MLIIKGWKILHVNNNINEGTLIIQSLFVFLAKYTAPIMETIIYIIGGIYYEKRIWVYKSKRIY